MWGHVVPLTHLLHVVLIVLQVEVDVGVEAPELDGGAIVGPVKFDSMIWAQAQAKITISEY